MTFESNALGLLSRIADALERSRSAPEEVGEIADVRTVERHLRLCRDCSYYAPDSAEKTKALLAGNKEPSGECRRRPPVIVGLRDYPVTRVEFPRLIATAWCGEFEPRT